MRLKVSWHGLLLLLFLCSEFFTHMPIYIYIYICIYMYMYIYTHMYIYILRRISESRCSILIGAPLCSQSKLISGSRWCTLRSQSDHPVAG